MEYSKPIISGLIALLVFGFASYHVNKPLPKGISHFGPVLPASNVAFLGDSSWVDAEGERQTKQEIFDAVFAMIAEARSLIVIDIFLFNAFQGPQPEIHRMLSSELTDKLIAQKTAYPDIQIVVISDPINNVYGGLPSPHFQKLRETGIDVVITKLPALRDSNPAYSWLWRIFIRPFGNSPGKVLKNPFGEGRVSVRSYLTLANFKANHRKTIMADSGESYAGLVMSANPHDGSSAHRNAAIRFKGLAALDLLKSENAVLKMSGHAPIPIPENILSPVSDVQIQIVTERKIKTSVLSHLGNTKAGDKIDLMMFYISDADVVDAFIAAKSRGADIRVLLDPAKDAFGHKKNGVPNRPVADALHEAGIEVRWAKLKGEQSHTKMLLITPKSSGPILISGSANYTRRNLNNLNLETDVIVTGAPNAKVLSDAQTYFDVAWNNEPGRIYSLPYEDYDDETWSHRAQYHLMEWSGISTF